MRAKSKKRKTNTEIVIELMEQSKHGALAQIFIIKAIGSLAEKVASSKIEDYDNQNIINPKTWIAVGKEVNEKINNYYKGDY